MALVLKMPTWPLDFISKHQELALRVLINKYFSPQLTWPPPWPRRCTPMLPPQQTVEKRQTQDLCWAWGLCDSSVGTVVGMGRKECKRNWGHLCWQVQLCREKTGDLHPCLRQERNHHKTEVRKGRFIYGWRKWRHNQFWSQEGKVLSQGYRWKGQCTEKRVLFFYVHMQEDAEAQTQVIANGPSDYISSV